MLEAATLKYLKALRKNNNKVWFDNHRSDYEMARANFATFIQAVIDKHGKNDAGIRTIVAKDCLYRINRDIRFAKDKTPYKTNFAASINKGGKQSVSIAGYYFHLDPESAFIGGGIWMPEALNLKKIRQEIDYNFAEFKKIIAAKKFKLIYGDLSQEAEYKLSRIPKGYENDNEAAEYLKLKSFLGNIVLPEKELMSGDLVKKTVDAYAALMPLMEFLNRSLHEGE